jgi:hypothetical protein
VKLHQDIIARPSRHQPQLVLAPNGVRSVQWVLDTDPPGSAGGVGVAAV